MARTAHARNPSFYDQPQWIERIISDTRLSPRARHLAHVFAVIATDGKVVASLARLANLTGFHSLDTITDGRKELERYGYVNVERPSPQRISAIYLVNAEVRS